MARGSGVWVGPGWFVGVQEACPDSSPWSERIRTYNFPERRVTDHRITLTLHKLDQILEGAALEEMIQPLIQEHQAQQLAALET